MMAQKHLWWPALAILAGLICVGNTADSRDDMASKCASINPKQRTDCGFGGITADQCKKKGCCYDDSIPDVKWCFNLPAAADDMASKCASINPKQRTDCGFGGIKADDCKKKGCCYDDSIPDVKWCFNLPAAGDDMASKCASINPKQRTDCGFGGITVDQCKKKGCCYDDSIPDVKWCFNLPAAGDDMASKCASINPKERTDCGFRGITADQCKKKGCCYDDSIPDVNWCFNLSAADSNDDETECDVEPSERVPCGSPNISPEECRGLNCCFDSSATDAPCCFLPCDDDSYNETQTTVELPQTIDCGSPNISPEECIRQNCCLDSGETDAPCCFQPSEEDSNDDEMKCNVDPSERVSCGPPDISPEDCRGQNCCFDSSATDAPCCFQPAEEDKILDCEDPTGK